MTMVAAVPMIAQWINRVAYTAEAFRAQHRAIPDLS
jgi:hypothetical protein